MTEPTEDAVPNPEESKPAEPMQTPIELEYAGPSEVATEEGSTQLEFLGNLKRDAVNLQAKVKSPLKLREGLATLYNIVGSDYRYVPKDRTRYIAYQRMKRETSQLNVWQAQMAYFSWLLRNDPLAFLILDPIITVHPDRVLFEVFSKDEGSYAALSFDHEAFEIEGKPKFGTTNIDFSENLYQGIQQMRSYRETSLHIGQQATKVQTQTRKGETLEKQIQVPDSWIRGFLQVQSAATLPQESFTLSPLDLYNVLRYLRLHADQKNKRRGLRVELMPGEAPTIVLEPWEQVFRGTGGVFKGQAAKVIRIWGRRRLMMISRLLPFIESIDVHVLGSGLPNFWVFRAGGMTLTLGFTGFTAANWSQSAHFDLLLPRKTEKSRELEAVVKSLSKNWTASIEDIGKAINLKGAALREALQLGCQQGQLMYDLATKTVRLRPLTDQPLPLDRMEFRNDREKQAHDLLARKNAVSITSENQIYGVGMELTGKVTVKEDKRDYRPQFLLTEDGNVGRAECTCNLFRQQGLKAGPCTHLIALRLAWAQQEIERATNAKARKNIVTETRTYSKRDDKGETLYQMTLDRKKLTIRWGRANETLRMQTLRFNSEQAAQADYLSRIDDLTSRDFLDATIG